ncbi:MAG: hypothetical protein ACFNKL_02025 [Treponema sp.]
MKFEPLFESENNLLVRISDGERILTLNPPMYDIEALAGRKDFYVAGLNIPRSKIEPEAGVYDEEFLAGLRTVLKEIEESGRFVFVIPEFSAENPLNEDETDSFIKAFSHTARRIKDARSVIGFALPAALISADGITSFDTGSRTALFMEELSAKHGHYLYFADESLILPLGLKSKIRETDIILFK